MLNTTKWTFIAEINNEVNGGDSPSTLRSALESVEFGYNPDPDNIEFMFPVENEIRYMILNYGENKEVADFLSKADWQDYFAGSLQTRAKNEDCQLRASTYE